MIFEHEIPAGSRLYFGSSAKLKREIEKRASEILAENGFEEISTPLFSHHQHISVRDPKELIRVADPQNREVTLRADSTIDVVRLVTKRLGRSTDQKRWFYIQPVYRYPTHEMNQIGAECIDGRLEEMLPVMMELFDAFEVKPTLQISNIQIPVLISTHFGIPLEWFAAMQVERLLKSEYRWLGALAKVQSVEELLAVSEEVPEILEPELKKIRSLALTCSDGDVVVAPLFYAKMRYYDGLFFNCFKDNTQLASGGHFVNEDITAAGFALYTDALIEAKRKGTEE